MLNVPNFSQPNGQGHLEFGGCDLSNLADLYGTPLYIMDEQMVRENMGRYKKSLAVSYPDSQVAYAGKAFLNGWICNIADEEGLYLDAVSGGEIFLALAAGFPAEKIIFHGNNKSPEEIELGLRASIGRFVVDNFDELSTLERLSGEMGVKPDIWLRVTPGIEACTHRYVETGLRDSKFGFGLLDGDALCAVKSALSKKSLRLRGLHSHIGSQILNLEGPVLAARRMVEFMDFIKKETEITLKELNLGGGLGISYTKDDRPPSIENFLSAVTGAVLETCEERNFPRPKLFFEPGRSIVGPAGLTLYTVGSVKDIPGVRTYVAVDGGMADNPRPALYKSKYIAAIANRSPSEAPKPCTIAGKCCESGDILIEDANLPPIKVGDLLAVFATGAYNFSMSSNYNRLTRPAVVAVKQGGHAIVVQRESYQDLIARDVFCGYRSQVAATEG